ncbi:MAG: hypothetical protein Q9215_005814 [Flavoplaca cf. flavocitrina]
MEGVGIAASIIGISAAGSQIAIKLYTLATQISTASDRVSSISNDVSLTSAVLQQLGELMTTTFTQDRTSVFSEGGLDNTKKSAAMCEMIFQDVERAANEASKQLRGKGSFTGGKVRLSRSEKLKWPFLQPSMDTLRKDLQEAKGTLMLMLQVTQLAFSRKTAEINQTVSTNVVAQQEIINAILAIQKQQRDSQVLEPLRYSPESTIAQSRLPNTANRPNVLVALPPPSTPITETTPTETLYSRASSCLAGHRHLDREDSTAFDLGKSSLCRDGVPKWVESTAGNEIEGNKNLKLFLMKPVIQDLGDVIQLSWKIHTTLMQQAEIQNQINKYEKEGLPSVHLVYQDLYAHEHAALEDSICKAGADSSVTLRSLKRIYIDLSHRGILFKGIPGLEFVFERTVQRPQPHTSPSTGIQAQSAASTSFQVNSSAFREELTLKGFLNDTSLGSWADEGDDQVAAAPTQPKETHQTLRRKQTKARKSLSLTGGLVGKDHKGTPQNTSGIYVDLEGSQQSVWADAKERPVLAQQENTNDQADNRQFSVPTTRYHACNRAGAPAWRRKPGGAGTLCNNCEERMFDSARGTAGTTIIDSWAQGNAFKTYGPYPISKSPNVIHGPPLPPFNPDIRDDGSPTSMAKQRVTDKQGRERLHGALTGGFNAGYFNTVRSKEKWTRTPHRDPATQQNLTAHLLLSAKASIRNQPVALKLETSKQVSPEAPSHYLTSLQEARPIKHAREIIYPDGIRAVGFHWAIGRLDHWVRYDVEFLLQFQKLVTETLAKASIHQRVIAETNRALEMDTVWRRDSPSQESLNVPAKSIAVADYSEVDDDAEDRQEDMGQGLDEKDVDKIVNELLGKYTTLFEGIGVGGK